MEHKFWLPEHYSLAFPAGDQIEVVAGLYNGGDEAYNVSAIYGSLNAAHDYRLFFQNFSGMPYYVTVSPGESVSLSYSFMTASNLPPREFLVALTVFYNTQTKGFASTFFNRTIDIVEKPRIIDFELIFLWLFLLGLLAGVGYLGFNYLTSAGFIKKGRKAKPSRRAEATNPNGKSEWLEGTFYTTAKPSGKKSSKDLKKLSEAKAS